MTRRSKRLRVFPIGCGSVILTPCKGDPAELLPLVRQKIIPAMPCACFGTRKNAAGTHAESQASK